MDRLPPDACDCVGRALLCQPAALATTACVSFAWRSTLRKHTDEICNLISRFPRLRRILMQEVPYPMPADLFDHHLQAEQGSIFSFNQQVSACACASTALLTVEVVFDGTVQAMWTGNLLASACAPIRLWEVRPKWLNDLNDLNTTDTAAAAAGWAKVRLRAFVTLGWHTLRLYESSGVGSIGDWSLFERVVLADPFVAPLNFLCCEGELSDDGVGKLRLEVVQINLADGCDHTEEATAADLRTFLGCYVPWPIDEND